MDDDEFLEYFDNLEGEDPQKKEIFENKEKVLKLIELGGPDFAEHFPNDISDKWDDNYDIWLARVIQAPWFLGDYEYHNFPLSIVDERFAIEAIVGIMEDYDSRYVLQWWWGIQDTSLLSDEKFIINISNYFCEIAEITRIVTLDIFISIDRELFKKLEILLTQIKFFKNTISELTRSKTDTEWEYNIGDIGLWWYWTQIVHPKTFRNIIIESGHFQNREIQKNLKELFTELQNNFNMIYDPKSEFMKKRDLYKLDKGEHWNFMTDDINNAYGKKEWIEVMEELLK